MVARENSDGDIATRQRESGVWLGRWVSVCVLVANACAPHAGTETLAVRVDAPDAVYTHDSSKIVVNAVPAAGRTIVQYRYDFGDGTSSAGSENTVEHVYSTPGAFVIRVLVVQSDGVTGEGTASIQVRMAVPPSAALVVPTSALVGSSVRMDASASSASATSIVSYAFDFGDGTPPETGPAATTSHMYSRRGTYTATVLVTDSRGMTSSANGAITIGYVLGTPVDLTDPASFAEGGLMSVDVNDNIDVVWYSGEGSGMLKWGRLEHQLDGTDSFGVIGTLVSDPVTLRTPYVSGYSLTRASDGALYLVWEWDPHGGGASEVAFTRASSSANMSSPLIVASGGVPHVVSSAPGEVDVVFCGASSISNAWFMQSVDDGATFGTPSTVGTNRNCPAVAVGANGSILIAAFDGASEFTTGGLQVFRSVDHGKTFSGPIDIALDLGIEKWATQFYLWSNGAGIVIAGWLEQDASGGVDFVTSRSTDDGVSWSVPTALVISSATNPFTCASSVFLSAGEMVVTYSLLDVNDGGADTFLLVSSDSGASFVDPLPIAEIPRSSGCPNLAARPGNRVAMTFNSPVTQPGVPVNLWFTSGMVPPP